MSRHNRPAAALAAAVLLAPIPASAQPARVPPPAQHDGAHDFDFLIGDWKAHVKRLPDRLVGSTRWVEYDGRSNHRKMFGTSANLEDFEVDDPKDHLHIKAQTLRIYNPTSHQWSIYGVDMDSGVLDTPPQVGAFEGGVGRFYAYADWKGRSVLIRYEWSHTGQAKALMEQAFSGDGGKTWEVNWICELSRDGG
ncbi:MAG TPA: DUF1579 domain-containing protein [Phenylobacterium sp.]|jgi:hypothetical protein|uniref:DUF1579 domain-containing protein n=1 Tax=Phenylobacterium sp. TaxID=1871053 RepID=UPI002C8C5A6C|nr:DUF1579 domain-containing protein [Phenylobacterium sp.]HXA39289.1 DUF1579 domain-containing protein [Phenylobacterium sp.]